MGKPIIWAEGALTSLGNTNFYSVLAAAWTCNSTQLMVDSDEHDVSTETGAKAFMPGLRASTLEIAAELKPESGGSIVLGSAGLVSFASIGITTHARAWRLRVEADEYDITEFGAAASGPTDRYWRPGTSGWSATIELVCDSATAQVLPQVCTSSGVQPTYPVLTMNMSPTTPIKFSGPVFLRQLSLTRSRGSECSVVYEARGQGALTPAGSGNPFGTTALGIPIWSDTGYLAGPYAGPWVLTTSSGRTFTGLDSFWRRIEVDCAVGSPLSTKLSLRCSGSVTPA